MTGDVFLDGLGITALPNPADEEACESFLSIVHQAAAQFLRAGGRVSIYEWGELTALTRGALAVEGDRLASEPPAPPVDPVQEELRRFLRE